MQEMKEEIIKSIEKMAGKYSPYNLFSDWVEMCAIAIQNGCCMVHDRFWELREQSYLDIARKYNEKELEEFGKMFCYLGEALTENMSDALGEIYMRLEMGSKYAGQFFTPFHLSELTARLCVVREEIRQNKRILLNEPSCGGGGMVIAMCKALHEEGYDFQRKLDVVAQDLDWKGVYMTYLQLSLIGCRAVVVQGDTLREPYNGSYPPGRTLRTPAMLGALI